jgi:hypothetical protein
MHRWENFLLPWWDEDEDDILVPWELSRSTSKDMFHLFECKKIRFCSLKVRGLSE